MIIATFIAAILAIVALHVIALRRAIREHHELMALAWSEPEEAADSGKA